MVASLLFPLLCWGTYVVQKTGSEERRLWHMPMSIDYEAFISELRALPPPKPGEAVFFDSHPIHFREEHLRAATEVGWRRTDLDVRLVSTFPVEARYKLHYQNRRLTRIP